MKVWKTRRDGGCQNYIKKLFFLSAVCLCALFLCCETALAAEDTALNEDEKVLAQYREYRERLESISYRTEIGENGYEIVENQIFPIEIAGYGEGEVSLVPAFDESYHRLALFFVTEDGQVIYKTDQLETNNRVLGQMEQPACDIAAVSFRDLDMDGRMDIILITACAGADGSDEGYKVGDVLFQSKKQAGFYRDYRIADKINRYGMNKSAEVITAFVRDGCSTEFLYTATTLKELLAEGLQIITEQCYYRTFGKLGKLQVVPGTYRISNYDVFMVYLVSEQGDILYSLQPMGDYDNLYALKGINCRDIDGDGLKDIVILARYSYEGEEGRLIVESDYSIYYQRTGGFSLDTEIKDIYRCSDEDTMEALVEAARIYWGWKA